MATLEQYNQWRNTLLGLLQRVELSAKSLSLGMESEVFADLIEQLKNDTFKIQIVGYVKNGKSTFVNALLGKELLPSDDLPCTIAVNEIKYGKSPKAVVNFCTPLPTGMLEDIPVETKQHIVKHKLGKDNGKDVPVPSMEVPYDQLSKYVAVPTIPDDVLFGEDETALSDFIQKIDNESPYNVVELYYPSEILSNGVEFVDSPGLGDTKKRTQTTLGYLKKADAVIYILDALTPLTEKEKDILETVLLKNGFNDLIMVINRFDLRNYKRNIHAYIQQQAKPYTVNKNIFAVSAKDAVDGFERGDNALLEKSGIPAFKQYLVEYLTQKKGFVKLNKPAVLVKNKIADYVSNIIPKMLANYDTEASALQARLNQALPELAALKSKRENMANTLDRNVSLAVNAVQQPIANFYDDLAKSIDTWISAFTPEEGWIFFPSKKDKQKVAEQILEHVKNKTTEFYELWNVNTFQGVLTQQAEFAFGSMENDVNSIAENINAIENILQGVDPSHVPDISAAERIAGIAAMLFLPMGRAGGDVFAGGFDFSRFMKTFAADLGIGIGVGLVAIWVWPPLGFFAAIIGALAGLLKGGAHATKQTKDAVAAHIRQALQENADQQIKDVVNKVRETFNGLKYAILKGIDTEIDNVSVQVEEIRNITTNGQRSIAQKRQQLENARTELNSVSEGIATLLGELEKSQNEAVQNS